MECHGVETPSEAAALADRLIVEHNLDALIVTQRVTAHDEGGHRRGARRNRPVVGQIWAVDGEEAASSALTSFTRVPASIAAETIPAERLINYASIPERLALTSRAWASSTGI